MTNKPSNPVPLRSLAFAGLMLCFLAFVGGAFVAEFHTFPYGLIFENPFSYIHARAEQKAMQAEAKVEADALQTEKTDTARVTITATTAACPGYTFVSYDTGRPSTARLLDMEGHVLHEWHRDFRAIWPNPPHRSTLSPESAIAWRYAKLFPNGDILTTIITYGDTPYGYGLVKLDKDSKVIWAVPDNFHHEFSIDETGAIYGLTHQWRDTHTQPIPGEPQLKGRILEDFLVKISPDGKELDRVSIVDLVDAPGYRELLSAAFADDYKAKSWDPIHANDSEVITAEFAAHHAFMKPGMVLVSLRELDTLVLVDMAAKKIVWSRRGPWIRQHDPDLLPDGDILLFDNRGDNVKPSGSRLIQFNPDTGQVNWSYVGTKDQPFRSDKNGSEERLVNGNTLVSEDDSGRLFEVTPKGEIVWEYHDVRMHQATRIAPDWLKFTPSALAAHAAAPSAGQNPG